MKNKTKATILKAKKKQKLLMFGGPKKFKLAVRAHKWRLWRIAKSHKKAIKLARVRKAYKKLHGKDMGFFGPIGMFLKAMFCKM